MVRRKYKKKCMKCNMFLLNTEFPSRRNTCNECIKIRSVNGTGQIQIPKYIAEKAMFFADDYIKIVTTPQKIVISKR